MTAKDDLLRARTEMLLVLDAKFGHVSEWRAFRALDSAMTAMDVRPTTEAAAPPVVQPSGSETSYVGLALEVLSARGEPVGSGEIFEFIRTRKDIGEDHARARRSIQTALSKDDRVRSVSWRGGRAWWYADREFPS